MSMADVKHTPGPWTSYPCNLERYSRVITANGAMVQIAMTKEVYGDRRTYEPGEETTANARLIAASPDLLAYAKCEEARSRGEDIAETVLKQFGFDPTRSTASEFMDQMRRAAITKAGGAA